MNSKEKLQALRRKLTEHQADGVFIFMSDAFLNEYRAPPDQRLEWLSGFDGSSGFAYITYEHAALFTDGRYILQAKQQVDLSLYQVYLTEYKTEWIAQHLHQGASILLDPWHLSHAAYELLTETLQQKSIHLKKMNVNIIDEIWTDRPSYQAKPAFKLELKNAGVSFADKKVHLQNVLDAHHLLGYIFGSSQSLNWLINIRGGDLEFSPIQNMYGIFLKNGPLHIFTHLQCFSDEMLQELGKEGIICHELSELRPFMAQFFLSQNGGFGYDRHHTPQGLLDLIPFEHLKQFRPIEDPCILLRAIKNETEQLGFKNAHIRDGVAFIKFLKWLSCNALQSHEIEIDQVLTRFRQEQPFFHSLSFPTIAGFAENGAIIHYRATPDTNKALSKDQLLLIDSGAHYQDGTTDMTRTLAIGEPTNLHRMWYTRVLKGHIAISKAIFPKGTTGAHLDALARQFLWHVGQDYAHGTGHGVGHVLNVHEGPHGISRHNFKVALQPGMIVSNEPGYYQEGAFGIRLENLLLVQEHPVFKDFLCFETLTQAPYDLNLIDHSLLDINEKKWIKTYHDQMIEKLTPFLSEDDIKFVQQITCFNDALINA